MLGVLVAVGALVLTRPTTGWAAVIASVLVGLRLILTQAAPRARRVGGLVVGAGLVSLLASVALMELKFGTMFSLPLTRQVWTTVNPEHAAFLAAHGGSEVSLSFLPSTLAAYFNPMGISVSSIFPFATLPTSPPSATSAPTRFAGCSPTASNCSPREPPAPSATCPIPAQSPANRPASPVSI